MWFFQECQSCISWFQKAGFLVCIVHLWSHFVACGISQVPLRLCFIECLAVLGPQECAVFVLNPVEWAKLIQNLDAVKFETSRVSFFSGLWKGVLSHNYIFFLWLSPSVFFKCMEFFRFWSLSEAGWLRFNSEWFLWYLDSVGQLLESYEGHIFVDPVKRAILRLKTKGLYLETCGLLFPSSANIVCEKEPCLTTIFNFFFLLTHTFRLFESFEPSLCSAIS